MRGKRPPAEQIVNKLRQAEVLLAQGQTIAQVSKTLGITDQTYYRWRKEYGGLQLEQAKKLKELQEENAQLKRALATPTLESRYSRTSRRETSKSHAPTHRRSTRAGQRIE